MGFFIRNIHSSPNNLFCRLYRRGLLLSNPSNVYVRRRYWVRPGEYVHTHAPLTNIGSHTLQFANSFHRRNDRRWGERKPSTWCLFCFAFASNKIFFFSPHSHVVDVLFRKTYMRMDSMRNKWHVKTQKLGNYENKYWQKKLSECQKVLGTWLFFYIYFPPFVRRTASAFNFRLRINSRFASTEAPFLLLLPLASQRERENEGKKNEISHFHLHI